MEINYLNLTNGIEWIPSLKDYRFVRIQSTHVEQHHWLKIIEDLDYDFLMNLAIGNTCIVHDCSQRKKVSRALFQGIPWIVYYLEREWLHRVPVHAYVQKYNSAKYFDEVFRSISETPRNVEYCKKFVMCEEIRLYYDCLKTEHDGDYSYYKNILYTINHHV